MTFHFRSKIDVRGSHTDTPIDQKKVLLKHGDGMGDVFRNRFQRGHICLSMRVVASHDHVFCHMKKCQDPAGRCSLTMRDLDKSPRQAKFCVPL